MITINVLNVHTMQVQPIELKHDPIGVLTVYGTLGACFAYLRKERQERMAEGCHSDTQKIQSITFLPDDMVVVGFGTI